MKLSSIIIRFFAALFLAAASMSLANAATLLPPGEQTFTDSNGAPLVGATISFYIPGTLTPKDTYQNAGQTILNSNPVVTDGSGRAIIYGSGAYRQIVKDFLGNIIWDQLTADTASAGAISSGGISAGTANAQTVSSGNFTSQSGQAIQFFAGFTNTSSLTIAPSGVGAIAVVKDTLKGPVALTGGEVVAGNSYIVIYDATLGVLHLATTPYAPGFGPQTTLASAATVNLGVVAGNNIVVSGSASISSFGTGNLSNPVYFVSFTGSPLLVNSAALSLPGGVNLQATPGSNLLAMAVTAGFQVISFNVAGAVGGSITPQGRLTLTATSVGVNTPVMTSNVIAATSVIYTPYLGAQVPVWTGAGFSAVAFTETSQLLSDTTLSPAAAVAASCYDEFEWSNGGTIVVTRGPAWTNCTTRGYTLSRVGGLLVNTTAVTNGPGAGFGVFVGSIATDAGGATVTWKPTSTAGQTPASGAFLNVWNAYNRVDVGASVADTGSAYTGVTTLRQARASTGNQITFMSGLAEETIKPSYAATITLTDVNGTTAQVGIGLNSTTSSALPVALMTQQNATGAFPTESFPPVVGVIQPQLGSGVLAALEGGSSVNNSNNASSNNTISAMFRM